MLRNAVAESKSTATGTLSKVATLIASLNLCEADSATKNEIVWKSVNTLNIGVSSQVLAGERFSEVVLICAITITSLIDSGVIVLTEGGHNVVASVADSVGVGPGWEVTFGLWVPETEVLVVTLTCLGLSEKPDSVDSGVGLSVVGGIVVVHDECSAHILNVQVEIDGVNEFGWAVVGHREGGSVVESWEWLLDNPAEVAEMITLSEVSWGSGKTGEL